MDILIGIALTLVLYAGIPLLVAAFMARTRRKRVAPLVAVFEPGTAWVDDKGGHFDNLGPFITGKFHGRQAEIAVRYGEPTSYVKLSLACDSSLVFEARPKAASRGTAGYPLIWSLLLAAWLPPDFIWLSRVLHGKEQWMSLRGLTYSLWTAVCIVNWLRAWKNMDFGDAKFHSESALPASIPGAESIEFSAASQEDFLAAVGRVEIRAMISRLIGADHVDLLCASLPNPLSWSAAPARHTGRLDAVYYYRESQLMPEYVQSVFSALQVLCQSLEAARMNRR